MSGFSAEDYGALFADELDISDVTSDGTNARILGRLKNDDPDLDRLRVGTPQRFGDDEYVVEDARGMGVLGYYLGRCTNVTELCFSLPEDVGSDAIEPFLSGLERNRSIKKVWLWSSHIPRDFFRMLTPFISGNPNLETFNVQCEMDAEQYRSLSLALREGRSLKTFSIRGFLESGRYDHEESIVANIEALKVHPHLENISFYWTTLGRNGCTALADLLRHSAFGIHTLYLADNNIDDSGLEALVDGLAHCRGLQKLCVNKNPAVTVRGWRALATLLEDPDSALQTLDLHGNGIDDESAIIFANALARNSSLTELDLCPNVEITSKGWHAFSKALCDTSSVNSTSLSNHTLRYLTGPGDDDLPDDLTSLLDLNREEDKKAVAIEKILLHHDDLDMQPLFEWDLKALPFVIEWLERAAAYEIECEAHTERRKLAAIYQFVRGMPELVIEGILGVSKKSTKMGR